MAEAFASIIIQAPVEAVWAVVRDFGGLPTWNPAVAACEIEDGRKADSVGCIRSFHLPDGTPVRERLLTLDDSRYRFAYNFETPAFPVENYIAEMELIPVTKDDTTFVRWHARFDEATADRGTYEAVISEKVFAAGLRALSACAEGRARPEGAVRWQGLRPAKVFCSSIIDGPVAAVWERLRDFAGMAAWHDEITRMTMLDGARADEVGGVRDFLFGEGALWEQLTYLSDAERAFRYRILKSPMPWLNYHAGPRLYPITADDRTFAVWTADWTAAPEDDLTLIPNVHGNVFQRAFDTLNERYFAGR